jgi:hypothetical protein
MAAKFKTPIKSRYKGKAGKVDDRAVTYADGILDRQINKVIGLLTVDSIALVSAINVIADVKKLKEINTDILLYTLEISSYLLLLSVLLSFSVLWVNVGVSAVDYSSIEDEFENELDLIRGRTIPIQIAIGVSLFAVLGITFALMIFWQQAAAEPPKPPVAAHIGPHDIFFDVNATVPRRESETALMAALQELEDKPTLKVQLEGHADDTGNVACNIELSKDRAVAVGSWLIRHGIDEKRLGIGNYGSEKPAFDNPPPTAHAWNRRVEFKTSEVSQTIEWRTRAARAGLYSACASPSRRRSAVSAIR